MLRRWGILLGMLTLLAGLAVATTGSASAGTMGFRPGGPIQLAGSASAVPNASGGIRHQAESTNSGWGGALLGRGHRGGAVLHGQRRHPAAG